MTHALKDEKDFKLEDWVRYHTEACECSGHFKCCGCTIKELEASWRKTLEVERSSYKALNERFARCQEALSNARSGS